MNSFRCDVLAHSGGSGTLHIGIHQRSVVFNVVVGTRGRVQMRTPPTALRQLMQVARTSTAGSAPCAVVAVGAWQGGRWPGASAAARAIEVLLLVRIEGLRGNLLGEGSLCGGPEANAACAPSGEPWPSAGAEGCAQLRARWCTRTSGVSLRRGRARRSCSLRSCPRCCRTRVAPTYRRSFGRGRSRRAQQAAQAARRQRMRRRRRWPLLQRTFLPLLSTRRAATSVVGHSGGGQ